MTPESDNYKMTPFEVAMKYVGIAVAIIYIALGVAIAIRLYNIFNLSQTNALIMGGLLIAYGVHRGYRLFKRHFHN